MAPTKITLALVATALWFVVWFKVRGAFSGVFVPRFPAEKLSGVPQDFRRNSSEQGRAA